MDRLCPFFCSYFPFFFFFFILGVFVTVCSCIIFHPDINYMIFTCLFIHLFFIYLFCLLVWLFVCLFVCWLVLSDGINGFAFGAIFGLLLKEVTNRCVYSPDKVNFCWRQKKPQNSVNSTVYGRPKKNFFFCFASRWSSRTASVILTTSRKPKGIFDCLLYSGM